MTTATASSTESLATTRGYRTLSRIADCIHTRDQDQQGRPALYVGLTDGWGFWVDQDGHIDDDSTLAGDAPSRAYGIATRVAARYFAR